MICSVFFSARTYWLWSSAILLIVFYKILYTPRRSRDQRVAINLPAGDLHAWWCNYACTCQRNTTHPLPHYSAKGRPSSRNVQKVLQRELSLAPPPQLATFSLKYARREKARETRSNPHLEHVDPDLAQVRVLARQPDARPLRKARVPILQAGDIGPVGLRRRPKNTEKGRRGGEGGYFRQTHVLCRRTEGLKLQYPHSWQGDVRRLQVKRNVLEGFRTRPGLRQKITAPRTSLVSVIVYLVWEEEFE